MELESVVAAVKEAGALALRRDFTVEQKDGVENIVTSADRAVQAFLVGKLSALLPGSGFYCEEDQLQESGQEYIWVIDPIDGTANFARGIPQYAISVALLHRDEPVLGVVFNPVDGHLFTACKGQGARMDGNLILVSDRSFEDGLFCTALSLYRKEFAPVCNRIIMDTYGQCNDVRRFGSCALELCYLAAGRCDLYFEIRVQPWDCAAAALILQEAGGSISSLHGKPLRWNGPLLVAAANTPENLRRLNAIISKHIKKIPYVR